MPVKKLIKKFGLMLQGLKSAKTPEVPSVISDKIEDISPAKPISKPRAKKVKPAPILPPIQVNVVPETPPTTTPEPIQPNKVEEIVMSDQLKDMSKDLEKQAELKAYSEAQHRTILELNRRLNTLEKENIELKQGLKQIDKQIISNTPAATDGINKDITDERAICEMQLSILRDRSLEGELSLEESKKVEIFAKLLLQLRNPDKKMEDATKKLDSRELLKLVEGGLDATNKPTS